MDKYGLTEEEQQTNLQQYNHALFRNMVFFMDIVWEINVLTGTAVVLEDKTDPRKNQTEFLYHDAFVEYLEERIQTSERGIFSRYMSMENLKLLKEEVSIDLHVSFRKGEHDLHRIVLTPAFDDDGSIYCVYLGVRNLQSEVRRAQAEYHGQEQFRDALMSNSAFHFSFDVTGDGMIHEDAVTCTGAHLIQEAVGRALPVPFEEFVSRWYECYQPQFEKKQEEDIFTIDYLKRAFSRNERLIDLEVKHSPPAGVGIPEIMQICVVLMENPLDRHIRAFVIWRDIGAFRRRAIESNLDLRSSNERLRRNLSQEEQFRLASLSGSLMVYNINLTRDLIEEEFYEIVDGERYPMLQLVGLTAPCSFDMFCQRWSERKVPEDSREAFLKRFNRLYLLDAYHRGEQLVEIEFDTAMGRGIPVTLRNTAFLMQDQETGEILAMVSGKDVSTQRADEYQKRESLRMAYEAANNASAAKSAFLARMSHDIRTPMNAIVGMTAIAKAHLGDTERVADCLNKISISSAHLLTLINDVLDMSQIESGKVALQNQEIFLPELVDGLLAICEPQILQKRHDFQISICDILHEQAVGDPQRIQQLLMNLMSNAIKFTPEGGQIRLTISEKPSNRPRIGCYEFILEDNGIGMSKAFQEHLFEPFSRAEDKRVEKIQGTGLGMSITKNIVQMMNGTIDVVSELNRGTKVTVVIFLKLQNREERASLEMLHGLPVLVADDDEIACLSVCKILEELGMKGEWVLTGREAVEKAVVRHEKQDDYFAVILDWKMPNMDGIATARELRRRLGDSVPLILTSAYNWSDVEAEAREAGVRSFLGKPLFPSRVAHLFHEITGQDDPNFYHSALDNLTEKDFSGCRALLAEDNDLNAEIAIEILGMTGLTVDRVENGKDAVEQMRRVCDGYYDIIFMDLQMPVMDGYSAARAIRLLGRDYHCGVPILAMSANAFAADVQASKAAGMNDHIAKPLDIGQLEQALNMWLPKRCPAV